MTDTTELEKRFAAKRAAEKKPKAQPELESQAAKVNKAERAHTKQLGKKAAEAKFTREAEETAAEIEKENPSSRKARFLRASAELQKKNFGSAEKILNGLLSEKGDDLSSLNLLAAVHAASGEYERAEAVLAQAIRINRKDYHAYINMARLIVQSAGDRDKAKRFYLRAVKLGSKKDAHLEKLFK